MAEIRRSPVEVGSDFPIIYKVRYIYIHIYTESPDFWTF